MSILMVSKRKFAFEDDKKKITGKKQTTSSGENQTSNQSAETEPEVEPEEADYSSSCAGIVDSARSNLTTSAESQAQFEFMREQYLKVFLTQLDPLKSLSHIDRHWIDALEKSHPLTVRSTTKPYIIEYKKVMYTFSGEKDQSSIAFGRIEGCAIQFNPRESGTSRVGGILFLSPRTSEVILVDVGGLHGWTVRRESGRLETSREGKRNAVICNWDETLTIQHADEVIVCQNPLSDSCITLSESR